METTPKLEGDWPEELLVPSVDQFEHGEYVYSKSGENMVDIVDKLHCLEASKSDREKLRYNCGTRCCLTGWAALAFGERGCFPNQIHNDATAQFLNKFIELAGRDRVVRYVGMSDEGFRYAVACHASNVFEGGADDNRDRIRPLTAYRIWRKTGDFFGYETGVNKLLETDAA